MEVRPSELVCVLKAHPDPRGQNHGSEATARRGPGRAPHTPELAVGPACLPCSWVGP